MVREIKSIENDFTSQRINQIVGSFVETMISNDRSNIEIISGSLPKRMHGCQFNDIPVLRGNERKGLAAGAAGRAGIVITRIDARVTEVVIVFQNRIFVDKRNCFLELFN